MKQALKFIAGIAALCVAYWLADGIGVLLVGCTAAIVNAIKD